MNPGVEARAMATVLLLRHGETAWNRERRVQGWAPTSLTERGREQARAAARALAMEAYDVDRIEASDLRRCRETARIVRATAFPDVDVEYRRAWRERDFGVMQGLDYGELFDAHPEYSLEQVGIAAARTRPERGESLLEMRERVLDRWTELCAGIGPDETVLVVTHGGPLYALVGHLRGRDLVSGVVDARQDNCALTEVGIEDGACEVRRENVREWEVGVDQAETGSNQSA